VSCRGIFVSSIINSTVIYLLYGISVGFLFPIAKPEQEKYNINTEKLRKANSAGEIKVGYWDAYPAQKYSGIAAGTPSLFL
jgi:hypothetical protein